MPSLISSVQVGNIEQGFNFDSTRRGNRALNAIEQRMQEMRPEIDSFLITTRTKREISSVQGSISYYARRYYPDRTYRTACTEDGVRVWRLE